MAVSAVKKEPAKGQEAAAPQALAPAAKNKGKLLKIAILLVSISALGGGAYWYFNQHHGQPGSEPKPQSAKPPLYVPLEAFTVNLQVEDNPQFLQTGLSLKVPDSAAVDALKLHMPEVRDRILLLLSGRKATELLTVDGKRKLGADIVAAINAILVPAAAEPAKAAPTAAVAQPPAATEAATPAEGEEKPPQEAAAPAVAPPAAVEPPPVPKSMVISVLFTSFIIQ